MSLVQIYQCLCDQTRLRILGLLADGPLCVCHFQEILGEPQVKISKHLAYLKSRGMVISKREANWMVYSLPARPSSALRANLACLQDCLQEETVFKRDRKRLAARKGKFGETSPICCQTPQKAKAGLGRT